MVRCAFSKDDWLPNAMFRPLIQVSRETDAALAVTSYLYADSQQASFVVDDGRRKYQAVHNVVTDTWQITNSRGQIVGGETQKGWAIRNACEMAFARIEALEAAE